MNQLNHEINRYQFLEKKEQDLVDEFSELMKNKLNLRHDRYMPLAWQGMDRKRMLQLLKTEIDELDLNPSDGAVDIANYAMFIWALSNVPRT